MVSSTGKLLLTSLFLAFMSDIEHASVIPNRTMSKRVRLREMQRAQLEMVDVGKKGQSPTVASAGCKEYDQEADSGRSKIKDETDSPGALTESEGESGEEEGVENPTSSQSFFASTSTAIRVREEKGGFVGENGRAFLAPIFRETIVGGG
jgi:hypothetical protein